MTFSLPNGKKFDLSKLRAGMNIDQNNEFLKKYDANQNSIFDSDELEKLKQDLEPYINDGIFDLNEIKNWYAKVMGITFEKLSEMFSVGEKSEEDVSQIIGSSFEEMAEAQAHRICIDTLRNNAVSASTSMLTRNNGNITDLYDSIKNVFGDILSPDQIYKVIFQDIYTSDFLEEAENGTLTKGNYLDTKIAQTIVLLTTKCMDEFENYEEFLNVPRAYMEELVKKYFAQQVYGKYCHGAVFTINAEQLEEIADSLNKMVDKILFDENESKTFFKQVLYKIGSDVDNLCIDSARLEKPVDLNELYAMPEVSIINGEELLNFEQTFRLERGIEFNSDAMTTFNDTEAEFNIHMGWHNRLVIMYSQLDRLKDDYYSLINCAPNTDTLDNYIKTCPALAKDLPKAEDRTTNIAELFNEYYGGDINAVIDLCYVLSQYKIKGLIIKLDASGKLQLAFDDNVLKTQQEKNNALDALLEGFKAVTAERLEQLNEGKTLDEYATEYNEAYYAAFGYRNTNVSNRIQEYTNDNQYVIDRVAGVGRTAGMVGTMVGGVLCFFPPTSAVGATMVTASGKLVMGCMGVEYAAKYTEALTRDEMVDGELADITKHFIMDAGGFIIGMKAGQAGKAVFAKLINKKLSAVLKSTITEENWLSAIKTVIGNKAMLANFLEAAGAKISKDLLISYVGDLVMAGVLDLEEYDWLTLLKSNLMGIVIGSANDIAGVAKMQKPIKPQGVGTGEFDNKVKGHADPETKSRKGNNENVDVTPATLPKTMEDIYNKAKNLTGNNITEQELNNFLSTLDASPESLLEYSKLIDVLSKYESGTKDLKAILDICNAKQLSIKDMNSLMEIAIDSMADPKDLFKISYEEVGFFKMAFDKIKVGISIQDFQSFMKTYTECYGKIKGYYELMVILSSDQEFLKYSAQLIEKYGKDPETAELLDIMGDGPIFIPLIEYAKNETDAIYRLKILKARVDLEYTDIDWRLSTKLLDIDINDFNNKMQKLDIILEQLNFDGKPKRDKLKQIINDLLQLDNESFANISKRNLWNIEANDWEKLSTISAIAQLSDIEFNHFKSRGLKVSRENIELAKLTNTEWQNLKKRQLDSGDLDNKRMVLFAKLSEHDWRIVEKYHLEAYKNLGTKEFKYLFSKGEQCIAKLQERKLLKHIGRYDIENIDKFVKMSDAEFSPIIERHLTEAIPNQHYDPEGRVYLTLGEMNRLRLLDENTFNKVWDILSTERGTIRNYLEEAGEQDTYLRPFTVDQAVELAQLSTQELVELKQSGAMNVLSMQDLRAFIDILNYVNVKDYNELTTADKKRLSVILVKHSEVLLFHLDFQKFLTEKYGETIIPNGRDGYCELLRKVIRESKIETNPLEKGQQEVFEKALADMASSNAFLRANFDAEGFKLELKYSRDKFMKDVFTALEGLSTSEKQKIMDYYGFEVYMKDGQLVMSGYPSVIKNRPELTSPQGKKVAELVERFAGPENRIMVKDNPVLSKMLNDIFDAFPELKGIIGKVQDGTHSYTVDVHTLKVLQGIMSNPKYKNLSAQDQKILTIATLLHDISIKEGEVDKQHPQNSATEAYQLLQKMSLTESERDSVYNIIKYHDWLEQYNTNADVAPEIAYALRNGNDFQLATILTEADLKGVQKNDAFWDRYKDTFAKSVTEISAMVKQIQQSQIYIPQTRLPKASQLIPDGVIVTKEVINGHEVTVLHIRKGQDLTKIGMDGISSDDIQLLYHGFSDFQGPKNLELVLSATDRDSDIVLSHSLISSLGQEVYAPYGIISYAPNSNIIAGNYSNLASGFKSDKTISKMVEKFVFGNYRNGRAYFPDKLKSKLNITDDAYIDLWNQISDMTLSELKRYDANLGAIMEEILLETDALRQQTRQIIINSSSESISEFVVEHIQIQAIGCPGGSKYLEGMPEYLLKYAEDNNLVIVSIEH